MRILATLILNSARHAPLALGVMVAAVGLAVWLYAPQVRTLHRPWRWLLPALRIVALVGLAICIVQPVVRRTEAATENGAVVILVDRSRSMSVRDWRALPALARGTSQQANAAGAELVDMADSLGMIPAGLRDESFATKVTALKRLSELADEFTQAKTELDFARLSGRATDAEAARVTALAGEMRDLSAKLSEEGVRGLASLPAPTAGRGVRWGRAIATALRLTQAAQAAADRKLYLSNGKVAAACDEVADESRLDVVERALTGPAGLLARFSPNVPVFGFAVGNDVEAVPLGASGRIVSRLGISADASGSNLTGSLATALARLQSQPLDAVIFFTDGRQVGSTANAPTPGGPAVPIFPVIVPAVGSNWATDVSISDVTAPQSAFVGQTIDIRGRVARVGTGGGSVQVRLDVDGKNSAARDVNVKVNEPAWVDFPVKMDAAGIHRLALEVAPLTDEATPDNNRIERAVKVIRGKVHVAAIAGSSGWDFQYVRNCLKRTDWVDLDDAVVSADAPLKLSADQIMGEEVVLLFNVPVEALSSQQWEAIGRLVKERGGSVIFAGGDAEVLSEYPRQAALAELWPFTFDDRPIWRMGTQADATFHLAPAADAADLPALALGPGDLAEQWAKLPAFFRYLPVAKTAGTRTLLEEPMSGDAVLTATRIGRGRVLVFGADETWRWREKIGERDQDRFWLQLIRFAMQEPYAAVSGNVALDADPVLATRGEAIALRARIASPSAAAANVQILSGRDVIKTVELTAVNGEQPGVYEGSAGSLPVGKYVLRLASADGGKPAELPIEVADSDQAEMADISPSAQPLTDLATASGGAVVPLDQIGTLPARIAQARAGQVRVIDHPIWDSPWLFLFVLACFAVEWAMRKRLGLA